VHHASKAVEKTSSQRAVLPASVQYISMDEMNFEDVEDQVNLAKGFIAEGFPMLPIAKSKGLVEPIELKKSIEKKTLDLRDKEWHSSPAQLRSGEKLLKRPFTKPLRQASDVLDIILLLLIIAFVVGLAWAMVGPSCGLITLTIVVLAIIIIIVTN
jgi:hypothetical protein